MLTYNPQNERIKRAYFTYLAEAKGFSEATLDGVAKALNRFETYTRFRDFKAFHIEQAKGFKAYLADQTSLRTSGRLSKATLYATLNALKRFFIWLAGQPGYKSRISYADAEYFNLSAKETRIAKAHRETRVPTLEQIRHVIRTMPAGSEIERRDRALIAFTILTGTRDGAMASLKLKHVDIEEGQVDHDARDVNTKFSKTFVTWFFPVGDDIRQVVVDWVNYLRQEKLWGLDDPLFPATKVAVGDSRHFEVSGLGSTGAARARSGPSSRTLSRRPACPTSIRTASERPLRYSEDNYVSRRRSTRRGLKISAMRTCLLRFAAMVMLADTGKLKSFVH